MKDHYDFYYFQRCGGWGAKFSPDAHLAFRTHAVIYTLMLCVTSTVLIYNSCLVHNYNDQNPQNITQNKITAFD